MNSQYRTYGPHTVGFDRFFDVMDRLMESVPAGRAGTTYPPYNIVKEKENEYSIQVAVAGFSEKDIEITQEESTLVVVGNKKNDHGQNYLHRGIAAREFNLKFTLADSVVVEGARVTDGMLVIALKNIVPEAKKPRRIPIGEKVETASPQLLRD